MSELNLNLSCPKLSGRLERLLSDKSRCCNQCSDVNSSENSSRAFPDASSHSSCARTPTPSKDLSSELLASCRRRRFDRRLSRSGSRSILLCDTSSDVISRSDVTAGGTFIDLFVHQCFRFSLNNRLYICITLYYIN